MLIRFFFSQPFSMILILAFFLTGVISLAEDHGGGAPAAGNAEGESVVSGKSRKGRAEKNFDEWFDLSQKLEKIVTKVKAKRQTIEELIIEKNKEKDNSKQFEIIKELNTHHHEYNKMVEDYERVRNYVLYRFPERANQNKRSYKHIDSQSVEEIEMGMSLDSKIKKIRRKISIQYGSRDNKNGGSASAGDSSRVPASQPRGDAANEPALPPEKTGVTETVILKK